MTPLSALVFARRRPTALALLAAVLFPSGVAAQCSADLTAVILVSGIFPGTNPRLELLSVSRTAQATDPSDEEMAAAVAAVYADDPYADAYSHVREGTSGSFCLYEAPAGDYGAATIIDGRSGQIAFAGTVVFMGQGSVVLPAAATHDCPVIPGEPAGPPAATEVLPNDLWRDDWGTQEAVLQASLSMASQTDFLRAIAACGAFSVVGYVYTPTTGATDPAVALEVLVISGRAAAPWAPPLAIEGKSLGSVKSLFR